MKKMAILLIASIMISVGFLSGCNEKTATQSNSQPFNELTSDVCYWDWKWSTTDHIGTYYSSLNEYQYEPKAGFTFAIVTIAIKNDASQTVSTNPWNWEMIVSSVSYSHHQATYDEEIGQTTVDVGKGGFFETKIVYEIPKYSTTASLIYTGFMAPTMKKDDTLISDTTLIPDNTNNENQNIIPDASDYISVVDDNAYISSGNYVYVFGLVKNTDAKNVRFVNLSCTLYDASNNIIAIKWTYTNKPIIKQDDTSSFQFIFSDVSYYHHYSISTASAQESNCEPYQGLSIQNYKMVTPEYGSQTIEGSIKNIGTEYADFPSVTAILYDNNGKIIGVPTGYISGMGMYSGQSESFEIYLFDFQRVPDTTIAKYNLEIGYMDYQMNC